MTPIYKVSVNGSNVTDLIKTRLLSLTITDEAGWDSDSVSVTLDDRDSMLEMPKTGASIEVSLGFKGNKGLVNMGAYTIDEVTLSGSPEKMVIRGKAADLGSKGTIKDQKTKQWEDKTVKEIVSEVASKHGLSPKVGSDLSGKKIKDLAQTDESDIHLLSRIAQKYDAVVKVTQNYLIFSKRGASRAVSGNPVPPIKITKNQCKPSYSMTRAERPAINSIQAKWHNKATAKVEKVETSSEKPQKVLRHTYDSKDEAESASKSELAKLKRDEAKMNFTLAIGNPAVAAEGHIILQEFREGINGVWNATSVTHTWSNAGATTRVSAEAV